MTLPRIVKSSKFQASFFQTLLIAVPLIFTLTDKNLDRKSKQEACIAAIFASSAVWGVAIHAVGNEDAAAKSNPTQPTAPVDPPPAEPPQSTAVPITFPKTGGSGGVTTALFVTPITPIPNKYTAK